MGALAQLSEAEVEVEPGRTAAMAFTVRNTGSVVDRFTFEAIGAAAPWVSFSPESLSLFPEASGTVNVLFAPPRLPTVSAGQVPLGIRVVSNEDPAGSVVEEATLTVAAFSDLSLELVPRIARGRRMARTQLAVDNRSNCPYQAEVEGSDPAGALMLACSPAVVDVAPGEAAFVKVRMRARRTFWRGPTANKPFRVALATRPVGASPTVEGTAASGPAPAGPHPASLGADGSMVQEALLPRWLAALVAAVIALAIIATILWFTVLRPQIRSTARAEVRSQLAQAGVTPAAGGGSTVAAPSGGGAPGAGAGKGGSTSPSTAATSSAAAPTSSGVTVNGTSQAGGDGTTNVYTVPSGQLLQVTDLLVENSAGSSGTLSISRDGTVLMQWALANFRDLDYHWIAPTLFPAGTHFEMQVSGCSSPCSPGIYYAGNLVRSS